MSNTIDPKHPRYWIVVADESNAIFYGRATQRRPLRELFTLDNEAARAKTRDLISDRGGQGSRGGRGGSHSMVNEKSDPKRHAATAFAKEIAEHIGKATHSGACLGYALVAAPRFLGALRTAVASAASSAPFATVDKEVVGRETDVIERLVADA